MHLMSHLTKDGSVLWIDNILLKYQLHLFNFRIYTFYNNYIPLQMGRKVIFLDGERIKKITAWEKH